MLFKILHGDDSKLNDVPFHEGHCYVTHSGFLYVDLNVGTKESPNNQRVKLNANQAESLIGYSISQLMNSTNSEIPTSKAVINKLKDYAISKNVTSQVFDNGSHCARFFSPGYGEDLDYYIHMGLEGELVHCVNNLCCLGIAAGTYEHNGVNITVEASTGKVKCSGAATNTGIFDLTNHDGIHLPRGKYYFSFGDNTIGFAEWDFGNAYIVNGYKSFVMDITTYTTVYPRLKFTIASNDYTYDFLTIAPQISLITKDDEKPIYKNWSLRTVYPKNSCHLLRNATKYGNNSILWTNYLSTILAYTASPKDVDDKISKELITSQIINKEISFFNNDFDSSALECYVSVNSKSNNSVINCVNNLCCLGIAAGTYKYDGITMVLDSYTGKLTFSGTATADGVRNLTTDQKGISERIPLKKGKYYCYFGSGLKEEYGLEWDFGNDYIVAGHRSFTIDLPSTGAGLMPKIKYKAGQEYNFTIYPQVSLIEHDDEKPTYKNWAMRNIFYVNSNGMAIINLSNTDRNILWSLQGTMKSYTICPKISQSTLNAANSYTNSQISGLELIKVVTSLPTTGQTNKIYLVPKEDSQNQDIYDEYVWVNKGTNSSPNWSWEWITTKQIQIDLTPYLTKEEAEEIYSTKQELEEHKAYATNTYATDYQLNETKNKLIGNINDASTVNSIMGAKKYADEKTSDLLNKIEDYAIEELPTENLFDKDNYKFIDGYYIETNNKLISTESAKIVYMSIEPNYYYNISKIASTRFVVGVTDNEIMRGGVTQFTNVIKNWPAESITIKAGSNSKLLGIYCYNSATDTLTFEEIVNSITVIKGKSNSSSNYSAIDKVARKQIDELNCNAKNHLENPIVHKAGINTLRIDDASSIKHRIIVEAKDVNLLDISTLKDMTITNANNDGSSLYCEKLDGGITGTGTPTTSLVFPKVYLNLPINTYTLSASGTFTNIACVIYLQDKDHNNLANYKVSDTSRINTFNLSNFPTYDRMVVEIKRNSNNIELSGTAYFQLEEGVEATEYHDRSNSTDGLLMNVYGKNLCSSTTFDEGYIPLVLPKDTEITISCKNSINDNITLFFNKDTYIVNGNIKLTKTFNNRIYETITLKQSINQFAITKPNNVDIIDFQIELGSIPTEYQAFKRDWIPANSGDFYPADGSFPISIVSGWNTYQFKLTATYHKATNVFDDIYNRFNILEGKYEVKSWEDVQAIVRAGQARNYFKIGDQLISSGTTIVGTESPSVTWDIIGIDQDKPSDESKIHSLTLISHEPLTTQMYFDAPESGNPNENIASQGSGDWRTSNIRQWLNSVFNPYDWWTAQHTYDSPPDYENLAGFLQTIPLDFFHVLGAVDKISKGRTDIIETTSDKFFLLSVREVYGGDIYEHIREGDPYEYYVNSEHNTQPTLSYQMMRHGTLLRTGSNSKIYRSDYGDIELWPANLKGAIHPACCVV